MDASSPNVLLQYDSQGGLSTPHFRKLYGENNAQTPLLKSVHRTGGNGWGEETSVVMCYKPAAGLQGLKALPKAEHKYIESADAFRAIATVWLLFYRVAKSLSEVARLLPGAHSSLYKCLDTSLLLHADLAVDVFLVLSGFFIGRGWFEWFVVDADTNLEEASLLRRALVFFKMYFKFVFHRFVRLSPVYYLAVFCSIGFNYYLTGSTMCLEESTRHIFFVANLPEHHHCAVQWWTVSLVMQLYLMTPFVVMITIKSMLAKSFFRRHAWLIPSMFFVLTLAVRYGTNEDLSEFQLATSRVHRGEWSPFARGGASYLVGIMVAAIEAKRLVSVEMEIPESYESTQAPKRSSLECCRMPTIIAVLTVLMFVFCGVGNMETFGPLNPQKEEWYYQRNEKEVMLFQIVFARSLFSLAFGKVFYETAKGGCQWKCLAKICRWDMWRVLARVSFAAYISSHFIIWSAIPLFGYEALSSPDDDRITAVYLALCIVVIPLCFMVGALVYLFIEHPCMEFLRSHQKSPFTRRLDSAFAVTKAESPHARYV
jgi:peptidoglycan/LPS O-acetylase OafA/YrhL